jgi:hypothetical protein
VKPTFYFPRFSFFFFLFLFTFLVIALSALFNARPAQAQSGVAVENVGAAVRFGEQITFFATLKASIPIQNASIIILDESQGIRQIELLTVQADGRTEFILDTRQTVIRPFSDLKWSYQITLSDGSSTNSEIFTVRYVDDRFNWQTLESGTLRVHWYQGDTSFGQAALDTVQSGLASVSRLVAVDLAQPVEFYMYANSSDLRATLKDDASEWIAGHADPTIGVVMVVIEPGAQQKMIMEQRIPHELMHVMMARAVGTGYQKIPAWLREGTAALAEIYPNPDYDRVLADAAASKDLIPMRDLCASFPADMGQAFLAYAEARSFTNYLHVTHGSSGLLKLASTYADGADCAHGAELALGTSLSTLETKWRASVLGQSPLLPTLQNMLPYLIILFVVLIIPFINILNTLRKKESSNEQ